MEAKYEIAGKPTLRGDTSVTDLLIASRRTSKAIKSNQLRIQPPIITAYIQDPPQQPQNPSKPSSERLHNDPQLPSSPCFRQTSSPLISAPNPSSFPHISYPYIHDSSNLQLEIRSAESRSRFSGPSDSMRSISWIPTREASPSNGYPVPVKHRFAFTNLFGEDLWGCSQLRLWKNCRAVLRTRVRRVGSATYVIGRMRSSVEGFGDE